MTEAMPFLRNTILLSYDTRSLRGDLFRVCDSGRRILGARVLTPKLN